MTNNQLDSDKPDLTGVHDSATCTLGVNGNCCPACEWANEIEVRREHDEWELQKAMTDYLKSAGSEALAQQVDRFMTERAFY